MLQQPPTVDEINHHIPASASYRTGDFRINPSNPPLARYLMGFGLLRFQIPSIDSPNFCREFMLKNPDALLIARIPMILVGLCICLLVYQWGSELGNGWLPMLCCVFSPNIIAHTRLATTDITFSFFFLLALYCLFKLIKNDTTYNLIITGICLGLAQLSKYSAILIPLANIL